MINTTYPIYNFYFKWSQDGNIYDKEHPNLGDFLPEGKFWNAVSFKKMFKETKPKEWLDGYALCWIENYLNIEIRKGEIIDCRDLKIEVEFYENETWAKYGWVTHKTLDLGQSDEELFSSFKQFAERKRELKPSDVIDTGLDKLYEDSVWKIVRWGGYITITH